MDKKLDGHEEDNVAYLESKPQVTMNSKRCWTAPIYEFYTISADGKYYECNQKKCSAKYPYVNPSTTNMRDHCMTKHCHIVLDPKKKCKMQDMVDSYQMDIVTYLRLNDARTHVSENS